MYSTEARYFAFYSSKFAEFYELQRAGYIQYTPSQGRDVYFRTGPRVENSGQLLTVIALGRITRPFTKFNYAAVIRVKKCTSLSYVSFYGA